jgi:hypothetical protein
VIVDGYNDLQDTFAADVELTLDTLHNANVQDVLWLNLHESRPEYTSKNAVLRAGALQHPELHILELAPPPPPPAPAPDSLDVPTFQTLRAQVGVALDRQLRSGSEAQLRWRTTSATLQRLELHLSPSGELTGTPSRVGTFSLPLDVMDAVGTTAHVTVSLTIARA